MVRYILVVLIALCSSVGHSQLGQSNLDLEALRIRRMEPPGHRRAGTLEGSATFAPSTMLGRKANNYYLTLFGEYHLGLHVSLRSDSYLYLNSIEDSPFINNAFRSYFGVYYHLNHSRTTNWDVTIGFQPGITAMSKSNYDGIQPFAAIEPSRTIITPSFAVSTGAKFYVWKYFNFFANLSYVRSDMGGLPDGPFNTDEIIFSAGLGFQINTINRYRF